MVTGSQTLRTALPFGEGHRVTDPLYRPPLRGGRGITPILPKAGWYEDTVCPEARWYKDTVCPGYIINMNKEARTWISSVVRFAVPP